MSLQNLLLAGNARLGGALPASQQGALPLLAQLRISDCNFSGPLPATWGTDETSMRQLTVL